MRRWRSGCLAELQLNGSAFETLPWARTAYIQPLAMAFDRKIYDASTHSYTASAYLDSLREQYGGIDSVLLWPTYTNIGADDRNQFELIEALPGGISGVRAFVNALHASGVHVLWPYNPWDQGTHGGSFNNSEAAAHDAERLAAMLETTDADGFFGDTISSAGHRGSGLAQFYRDSVAAGHPAAIQPEGGGTAEGLNFTVFGWGYWTQAGVPSVPPVDLLKWLEPRYVTQVCDRWLVNKTHMMQLAFFNGDGIETWQNIWGIWYALTPRDAEALKRVSTILRHFGGLGFLQSPAWHPHYPLRNGSGSGVFASAFPLAASGETLFLAINVPQPDQPAAAAAPLVLPPATGGWRDYDCYRGVPLDANTSSGAATVVLEAHGYGCVWRTRAPLSAAAEAFLTAMRELTARGPLESFNETRRVMQQTMTPVTPTARRSAPPPGMLAVPGTAAYHFVVSGHEIEGRGIAGADVQYPWESGPTSVHNHTMPIHRFYMDRTPVTCGAYATFLTESKYQPRDDHNFLKNWRAGDNATAYTPPAELVDVPVSYVSLREARAYCEHYGKRLPASFEWQYAAQGTDGRPYPWGTEAACATNGTCCPALTPKYRNASSVWAHPAGASPFGMLDMVGNVWQFTDEFTDEHTRATIVRGGSFFAPQVPDLDVDWYFPNGPEMRRLDAHGKYFLMDDSYERCGTIGFRCAADAL